MTDLLTVDENTFDEVVLRSEKPVLVDFWRSGARPATRLPRSSPRSVPNATTS